MLLSVTVALILCYCIFLGTLFCQYVASCSSVCRPNIEQVLHLGFSVFNFVHFSGSTGSMADITFVRLHKVSVSSCLVSDCVCVCRMSPQL